MRNTIWALLASGLATGVAVAEPVDGKTAKKMLFSPRGVELLVLPDSGLDAAQSAIIQAILQQMKDQGLANYYGALAVSPDFFAKMAEDPGQAALSGLLQVTEMLHNPEAAADVALAACKKALSPGDAPCVLAARVLPKKWEPQPVSLSVDATRAFKNYKKGGEPKALAISAATVSYAIAKGEGAGEAALATCNEAAAKTGSPDCEVVIAD